jgi:CheY-like chemotaxis protein
VRVSGRWMTTKSRPGDPVGGVTQVSEGATGKKGMPNSPTKTVLIVDDQEDERAIQRAMLEHLGYRVTEAPDGVAALEAARAAIPDLVLLDIAMPRMDGLTVCRHLRDDPRTSSTVVLFYTATPAAEELRERVRRVGGAGILVKPLDPRDVAHEVSKLIGPAPARVPPARDSRGVDP